MFTAINKNTNARYNLMERAFNEDFFKNESWIIDPINVKEDFKDNFNYNEEVIFKKESKEIINEHGTSWTRNPHFSLKPKSTEKHKLIIPTKKHTFVVDYMFSMLKKMDGLKLICDNKKYFISKNVIDFSNLNVEVPTNVFTNNIRADIMIPFKRHIPVIGYGLIIEIQLTEQDDRVKRKRTFDRSKLGYSVSWLESDFIHFNLEDFEYIPFGSYLENTEMYIESQIEYMKNLAINYEKDIKDMYKAKINSMLGEYKYKFTDLINEISKMQKLECPDCGKNMVLKKGKFGEFWGCSDYPRCKRTIKFNL